ncbi:MAG TPA: hypothetical protein PLH94_10135 [Fimbriimonadaceae bacterium]|nr:hypothetical protein [Fimbriimonadaceae bacterium]
MSLDARFHAQHSLDKASVSVITQAFMVMVFGHEAPGCSPEDVAHAKALGYWHDDALLTHDEAVARCISARNAIDRDELVRGFIFGLATNRPDWWAALASYGYARHLAVHNATSTGMDDACSTCGLAPTQGSNIPWQVNGQLAGILQVGARPNIISATSALLFASTYPPFPEPTPEDLSPLITLLDLVKDSPPKTTAPKLAKLMKGVCGKSIEQRLNIVEALSVLGILAPHSDKATTYFEHFFPFDDTQIGNVRTDTEYPALAWNSDHGVNADAVEYWFGRFLR